jgi:hypothetical protein
VSRETEELVIVVSIRCRNRDRPLSVLETFPGVLDRATRSGCEGLFTKVRLLLDLSKKLTQRLSAPVGRYDWSFVVLDGEQPTGAPAVGLV